MLYQLTINLHYQLIFAVEYKWTKAGLCVNTKTGNIINSCTKDRCEGFYIRGKFYSKTYLRKQLERIPIKEHTPF